MVKYEFPDYTCFPIIAVSRPNVVCYSNNVVSKNRYLWETSVVVYLKYFPLTVIFRANEETKLHLLEKLLLVESKCIQ